MAERDLLEKIKNKFEELYENKRSLLEGKNDTDLNLYDQGYLKGILDAIELFTQQAENYNKTEPVASDPPVPEKLYEYSPEAVLKLNSDGPALESYPHEELIETAFMLENQHLQLLGDVNTLPYDAYQGLPATQLAVIILNCCEEIIKISRA